MKKLIRRFFGMLGLEIRKAGAVSPGPAAPSPHTMLAGMMRMKKLGIAPATIVDLGAAAGTWAIKAASIWPDTSMLLLEPLEERKADLAKLKERFPRFYPVTAAAGSKAGKISFLVSDDLDGSGVYDAEKKGGNREVELTTIDNEIARLGLKPPFALKFDTHGFELPILEGSRETLKNTSLIVMECYGFHISADCLTFPEMCAHLKSLGFRLADIVEVVHRPKDQLFWQCDAFFLREDHPSFSAAGYN